MTKKVQADIIERIAEAKLRKTSKPLFIKAISLAHKLGISAANVEFSGYGDSGDVEEASLFRPRRPEDPVGPMRDEQPGMFKVAEQMTIFHESKKGHINTADGKCYTCKSVDNPEWTENHERLKSAVDEIAQKEIGASEVDWYNETGGGGDVFFDFVTGKVKFYIYRDEIVKGEEKTKEFNLLGKKK